MTDQEINEAMARIEGRCIDHWWVSDPSDGVRYCHKCDACERTAFKQLPDYCNSRDDAVRVFEGLTNEQQTLVIGRIASQDPIQGSLYSSGLWRGVRIGLTLPARELCEAIVEVMKK